MMLLSRENSTGLLGETNNKNVLNTALRLAVKHEKRLDADVVKVVHICEATLTKRLIEFENTKAGSLTVPNYPDPGRCWDIVDKYKVTIFYTAPTLVRLKETIVDLTELLYMYIDINSKVKNQLYNVFTSGSRSGTVGLKTGSTSIGLKAASI
ncbi:Acetyl-coenzyme A synthetase chloroplastic/glyoxysomal [Artemisia annua]|uniref:Acetyl-coenzyme A synthetase chloroplastic/glyoxysomal n=1 Tax=Artemisia annua TaxID=35608 RepID=A0A2U1NS58_ARTAN|nr:Acetyl-coenzyme A synthetase chloroplastic/glyoxysomal [Artemisia annua]